MEDRPGTKSTAKVKYFSNPKYPRYEAVAYIDGHKAGVIIVMSAKSKNDFDKNLPVFEDLVKSYFFVADKVSVN